MKKYRVALDDGHGMATYGKRTPAISSLNGRVIKENEFNRAVTKELNRLLQENGNFETVFTAPTDADTSLAVRCKVANDFKADIFVSIHANASDGKFDGDTKDASGVETWYMSTRGKELAECVQKELVKGTKQKNRGIKKSTGLYVLKHTNMPAILTENLFMDNEREARLMIDKKFINEVASEHYVGICNYFKVEAKEITPEKPVAKPVAKSFLVEITASVLNVRKGPSTSYPVTTTVRKGQVYTIVEEKGSWGKLKSGAGWIHLGYAKRR